MTIDELNRCPSKEFIDQLGAIYEHSSWVAAGAEVHRPFGGIDHLHRAMAQVVDTASEATKRELVCAHPDLAGRLARAGALAPASAREQSGLGLDRLSEEEYAIFDSLNRAYQERFGFPFVIAVKRHTRASIQDAFRARLGNSEADELRTAIAEIHLIARFRLEALLTPSADSESRVP
jgi:2-oxo-4-hydroxy-4-carboxy-5-ureidoimidazoline decarboxylase